MQLPFRFRISRLVTSLVYQLKHGERRRSLALILRKQRLQKDKTLPENASKQYGLQTYQFEPYTAENESTDDSKDQKETPVDCEHGRHLHCIEW